VIGCWKATSRGKFLTAVLAQPKVKKLLSSDHFSVDGTLIEAWASMKSVRPKDGSGEPPAQGGGRNAEADFHGLIERPTAITVTSALSLTATLSPASRAC
jgi:hypothetical protein